MGYQSIESLYPKPHTLYPIPLDRERCRLTEPLPTSRPLPALWHEPAPPHFDLRLPWWFKSLIIIVATVLALFYLDQRVALWAFNHPIPDLMRTRPGGGTYGDSGRELMFLEQFGQFACSVVVILAVAFIDPAGRRRALAIAIGCLVTLAVTHLMKDLIGRSRPFTPDAAQSASGLWEFRGWWWGFHGGTRWGSFPSAHTTGAFALASGLAWFYPRGRCLFMVLATTTATLRVLHTAHYVSDVIAGMGIGVFVMRLTLNSKIAGRLIVLAPRRAQRFWFPDLA
jgi:membrane-associated phospholipid phosphatase